MASPGVFFVDSGVRAQATAMRFLYLGSRPAVVIGQAETLEPI